MEPAPLPQCAATWPSTPHRQARDTETVKVAIGIHKPGIGVTASEVRMRWSMIHGCRPTSVTTHPASMAMKPNGAVDDQSIKELPVLFDRALDKSLPPLHSVIAAISIPQATIN